jgi:hypothetical protein
MAKNPITLIESAASEVYELMHGYTQGLLSILASEMIPNPVGNLEFDMKVARFSSVQMDEVFRVILSKFVDVKIFADAEHGTQLIADTDEIVAQNIIYQMGMDSSKARSLFKTYKIEHARLMRIDGMSARKASEFLRSHFMSSDVKRFTHRDKIGKHWKSEHIAKLKMRKALLDAFNIHAVASAKRTGQDFLVVDSEDKSNKYLGLKVYVSADVAAEAGDGVTLYEVDAKVFHPNSRAYLVNVNV